MSEDLVKRLRAINRNYELARGVHFEIKKAADHIEAQAAEIARLRDDHNAALVVIFECMQEIDDYIRHEYPGDHPVHERYRQRDYSANPARIFLQSRADETLRARAALSSEAPR